MTGAPEWKRVADAADVAPNGIVGVEAAGLDLIVWRASTGALSAMPRWCPHLDWDLTEAWVDGCELHCPGHGWAFDGDGHAFKRNEFGRVDPKDDVEVFAAREHEGAIEVRLP